MGPLAIDMYLPALPTIARELGMTSAVGAGQPGRLLHRHRDRTGVLRTAVRSLGTQARALFRPRRCSSPRRSAVRWPRDVSTLIALPLPAGARRLRAARRAARGRARLFRSARLGAHAVGADAGDGARADPGAARRWSAARQLRLALGLLGARRLRRRLARARRAASFPKACRPRGGSGSASATVIADLSPPAARPRLHGLRAVGRR